MSFNFESFSFVGRIVIVFKSVIEPGNSPRKPNELIWAHISYPVDLCIIFQCNLYISCIMSCGNEIVVSNCLNFIECSGINTDFS